MTLLSLLAAALTLGWNLLGGPHGPWREVCYKGHTVYTVERDSVDVWLHAEAHGTNSVLFHSVPDDVDVTELSWRWRVLRHPAGADPSKRKLDDRAAAVFVLVHRSLLPWRTRALIYQWAPAGEQGQWASSPYAPEIRVLTLELAPAGLGWRAEKRDLRADLLAEFGAIPEKIEAIGVLCDADNTAGVASAEFGALSCTTLESRRRRP